MIGFVSGFATCKKGAIAERLNLNNLAVHRSKEFLVALGATHAFEQFVHSFFGIHIVQVNAEEIHALKNFSFQEKIIATC